MSRYDELNEVRKHDSEAKTFEEILKFNPYHDAGGRFASANGATSFTIFTNSPAGQKAIANIRERELAAMGAGGAAAGGGNQEDHKMVEGKDLLETMDPKEVGKMTIEEVLKEQGFDGKPKVVSSIDEFDKAVAENNNIEVRGIGADDDATADAYVDQLKNGEFFVKCEGGNAMGRGMYCAASYNGTNDYDDAAGTAESFGINVATRLINMTLDKSAKTIEFDELEEMAKKDGKKLGSNLKSGPMSWAGNSRARNDIGAYAAAKGFDAITNRNSAWRKNFMVVLNRTKLTILDPTGHLVDDIDGGADVIFNNRQPF